MKFNNIWQSCGMKQYFNAQTYVNDNTLDVGITQDANNTVSMVEVTDLDIRDGLGKVSRDHCI